MAQRTRTESIRKMFRLGGAKTGEASLLNCRTRVTKIKRLLESKKELDLGEFLTTVRYLDQVFNDDDEWERGDAEESWMDEGDILNAMLSFYNQLKKFHSLLKELVRSGRFRRLVTNNRTREKLEVANFELHNSAVDLLKKCKVATSKYLGGVISDPGGEEWWTSCFGADQDQYLIKWENFESKLLPAIWINPAVMKYLLDNANTGFCSKYKFGEFLKGFGPFENVNQNVQNILSARYFHGFLSSEEAERLIYLQPKGTYLLRFSQSSPGSFAICFIANDGRCVHALVKKKKGTFAITEKRSALYQENKTFNSVSELLEFYQYILKFPFDSELARISWFHGDLTSAEAEAILADKREGSYLFRFSSRPGFLAATYVQDGVVKHALVSHYIEGMEGKAAFRFDGAEELFNTLDEVVESWGTVLVYPVRNNALTENILINPKYEANPEQRPVAAAFNPGHYASTSSVMSTFASQQAAEPKGFSLAINPPQFKTAPQPAVQPAPGVVPSFSPQAQAASSPSSSPPDRSLSPAAGVGVRASAKLPMPPKKSSAIPNTPAQTQANEPAKPEQTKPVHSAENIKAIDRVFSEMALEQESELVDRLSEIFRDSNEQAQRHLISVLATACGSKFWDVVRDVQRGSSPVNAKPAITPAIQPAPKANPQPVPQANPQPVPQSNPQPVPQSNPQANPQANVPPGARDQPRQASARGPVPVYSPQIQNTVTPPAIQPVIQPAIQPQQVPVQPIQHAVTPPAIQPTQPVPIQPLFQPASPPRVSSPPLVVVGRVSSPPPMQPKFSSFDLLDKLTQETIINLDE